MPASTPVKQADQPIDQEHGNSVPEPNSEIQHEQLLPQQFADNKACKI